MSSIDLCYDASSSSSGTFAGVMHVRANVLICDDHETSRPTTKTILVERRLWCLQLIDVIPESELGSSSDLSPQALGNAQKPMVDSG